MASTNHSHLRERVRKLEAEYKIGKRTHFHDVVGGFLNLLNLQQELGSSSIRDEESAFELYLRMMEENGDFRDREIQPSYLSRGFETTREYVLHCAREFGYESEIPVPREVDLTK